MPQGPFQRRRGRATTLPFVLFNPDGIDFQRGAVHVTGDTTLTKDEGAEANTGSGFTDEGSGYSIPLTDAEMQAARITVYIADDAGSPTDQKRWLDTAIYVETFEPPGLLQATDIATLAGQNDFTLAEGSGDDDTYNGMMAVIQDAATLEQKAVVIIADYVGSTKTVTLLVDPTFTIVAGDYIDIIAISPKLGYGSDSLVVNTAKAGTLTNTQMSTNVVEATDEHFNGKVITWLSGVLRNESATISDYVGVNGVFTFGVLAGGEAPSAGDLFVIH